MTSKKHHNDIFSMPLFFSSQNDFSFTEGVSLILNDTLQKGTIIAKQATQPQEETKSPIEKFLATAEKMIDVAGPKLVAALHDIHRRVIEEPWFGKPVFDVLYNANQRAAAEKTDKLLDEDRQPATHQQAA